MENQKISKIIKQIDSILETTPGIIGLVSLLDGSNKNKNNWIKIEDIRNNGSLEISIAIVINRNITVKNLSNEIFETINFYFKNKKQEYLLKKLNIYIKGVK